MSPRRSKQKPKERLRPPKRSDYFLGWTLSPNPDVRPTPAAPELLKIRKVFVSQALEDVKVSELSCMLAMPHCTTMFGNLGVDIIRLGKPGACDEIRHGDPPWAVDPFTRNFKTNRNKEASLLTSRKKQGIEPASFRSLIGRTHERGPAENRWLYARVDRPTGERKGHLNKPLSGPKVVSTSSS